MDTETVALHREKLLTAMPGISSYIKTFHSINKRWGGAITSGMVETGYMKTEVSALFGPLIQDMRSTKIKYSRIQEQLVDAIQFEMVDKVVSEISDAAKFAINMLKRNLFERTADVGYLATDAEIVNFLKLVRDGADQALIERRRRFVQLRLADYQYEYTVYNEIIVLDTNGNVQANLDRDNPATHSADPLLRKTQAIDLHDDAEADKYLETFRPTDLRPGRGNVLIYSQKIEDPDDQAPLGTLCLCFDFEDEMEGIFRDLNQGNNQMVLAVLNERGRVICSNNPAVLPMDAGIQVDLNADFSFFTFKGRSYLASIAATDGYQGFFGLTWYGLAMIDTKVAFSKEQTGNALDKALMQNTRDFSTNLSAIQSKSEDLLSDMKIDSVNGRIMAVKFRANAFVELLHFVNTIGEEINGLFADAIADLQHTIVTSLFNDVQFRAFQGNNIADRNLYERANDVCWWALTPLFRALLTKHHEHGLTDDDRQALTTNLQYINDLYTPYLRLVLLDTEGVVVAASNPPDGLNACVIEDDLPTGQGFVGMTPNDGLAQKAMALASSKDYCVSDFASTPLYGGRPTYIYSTAVRDPQNDRRVVGAIEIVFDAEPQFKAMLKDALPKDAKKQILTGSFGVFTNRGKTVISSTNQAYPPGSKLPLDDALFLHKKGQRTSTIVEMDSRKYVMGLQVSEGYREFKQQDGYVNDVICMIFAPL